jgi:Transcriptional Coactivator p15 (PC4)
MPGAAAGQEKDLTMNELTERTASFNKNTIWSAEFSLNGREIVRVELGKVNGTPIVNVRRWFTPPDGELARPTRRGLAFALKHLPTLAALLNEALHHARVKGLLPTEEGADALLRDGGCS